MVEEEEEAFPGDFVAVRVEEAEDGMIHPG